MYEQRMEVGDANILELNKVKLDVMEVKALVTEARNERILLLQQLQQLNGGQAIEVNMTTMPEFAAITDYKSFEALALANDAGLAINHLLTDRLSLEFSSWVARMRTPEALAEAIRLYQQSASAEVKAYFELQQDGSFTSDTIMFEAHKAV